MLKWDVRRMLSKSLEKSKGELEMKLCDCPYNKHCHEPRQWVAVYQKREPLKCDFYHWIKETLELPEQITNENSDNLRTHDE